MFTTINKNIDSFINIYIIFHVLIYRKVNPNINNISTIKNSSRFGLSNIIRTILSFTNYTTPLSLFSFLDIYVRVNQNTIHSSEPKAQRTKKRKQTYILPLGEEKHIVFKCQSTYIIPYFRVSVKLKLWISCY